MPVPTPKQKVEQVKMFGGSFVEVILSGDTFDDAYEAALEHCESEGLTFIHPFDDEKVIEGQLSGEFVAANTKLIEKSDA